eukprot:gene15220-20504_t
MGKKKLINKRTVQRRQQQSQQQPQQRQQPNSSVISIQQPSYQPQYQPQQYSILQSQQVAESAHPRQIVYQQQPQSWSDVALKGAVGLAVASQVVQNASYLTNTASNAASTVYNSAADAYNNFTNPGPTPASSPTNPARESYEYYYVNPMRKNRQSTSNAPTRSNIDYSTKFNRQSELLNPTISLSDAFHGAKDELCSDFNSGAELDNGVSSSSWLPSFLLSSSSNNKNRPIKSGEKLKINLDIKPKEQDREFFPNRQTFLNSSSIMNEPAKDLQGEKVLYTRCVMSYIDYLDYLLQGINFVSIRDDEPVIVPVLIENLFKSNEFYKTNQAELVGVLSSNYIREIWVAEVSSACNLLNTEAIVDELVENNTRHVQVTDDQVHEQIGKNVIENAGIFRVKQASAKFSNVIYALPKSIQERLESLIHFVNSNINKCAADQNKMDVEVFTKVLKIATVFFSEFLLIHPFSNGNGRTARILLNFILKPFLVVPFSIYLQSREEYIQILEKRNNHEPPCHLATYLLLACNATASH